jgi:hypothetical protein
MPPVPPTQDTVGGNARFALGHPEKIVARQAPKRSTAKYQKMNKELLP